MTVEIRIQEGVADGAKVKTEERGDRSFGGWSVKDAGRENGRNT